MNLDCFPTAMANMFKWAGKKVSYREERFKLYKILKFDSSEGTDFRDSERVMKIPIKGLKVKRQQNSNYKSITNILRKGGCVILSFKTNTSGYHAALIIKENKKTLTVVNYYIKELKETITYVPKNVMKKYMRRENIVYFIKKVKNE
jgi:hypothetical protein